MPKSEYCISHFKATQACTIEWTSDKYRINDLEPYISSIECDDGEDYHHLLSDKGDFEIVDIDDFEAIEDSGNACILCFTAWANIDLDQHPTFKEALEKSGHQVLARVNFKKNGESVTGSDGVEEVLFEMDSDTFVELQEQD